MTLIAAVPPSEEGAKRGSAGVFSNITGILHPLDDSGSTVPSTFPSVCIHCGAYQLFIEGEKQCPICQDVAPDAYASCVDYEERLPLVGGTLQGTQDYRKLLIALDSSILGPDLVSLVFSLIERVPDNILVSIVLFDHFLRALRLGEGNCAIVLDVLPRRPQLLLSSFLPQQYALPAGNLKSQRERLESLLGDKSLQGGRSHASTHLPVLEDLLDFAAFLNPVSAAIPSSLQLVAFTSKGLTLRPGEPTLALKTLARELSLSLPSSAAGRNSSLETFDLLAYQQLQHRVVVEVVFVGHRMGNFPQLTQLCSGTGGRFLQCELLSETSMQTTVQRDMHSFCLVDRKDEECILVQEGLDTIEVRGIGLELDRITGPVVGDHILQVLQPSSPVFCDPSHVIDPTQREGISHWSREHATLCGFVPALYKPRDCMLTLQFLPTGLPDGNVEGPWKVLMPWRQSHTPTRGEARTSLRPVFQIVLRSRSLRAVVGANNVCPVVQRVNLTRVWTMALPQGPIVLATPSRDALWDHTLWGFVLLRGMVADMHVASALLISKRYAQSSSSEVQPTSMEAGIRDEEHALRKKFTSSLDSLAKTLVRVWANHDTAKQAIMRMIFHLREGALLNGPSVDTIEGYLQRALFLASAFPLCLRMLLPAVTMDTLSPSTTPSAFSAVDLWARGLEYDQSCAFSGIAQLYPMPPETSSLLPNTCCLVDVGTHLIVFYCGGPDLVSGLLGFAESIALERQPVAIVYVVYRDQHHTYKRRVYANLSSAHMGPMDLVHRQVSLVRPPEFSLTREDLEAALRGFPYTDELYFAKYLQLMAPSLIPLIQGSFPTKRDLAPSSQPVQVMTMHRTPAPQATPFLPTLVPSATTAGPETGEGQLDRV